jgi:hypothetical protein
LANTINPLLVDDPDGLRCVVEDLREELRGRRHRHCCSHPTSEKGCVSVCEWQASRCLRANGLGHAIYGSR